MSKFYGWIGASGDRKRAERKQLKQSRQELPALNTLHWQRTATEFQRDRLAWPTTASALYALARTDWIDNFSFSEHSHETRMLSDSWGIRSERELREQLVWLLRGGHRVQFNAERTTWSALKGAEERRTRNSMYEVAKFNSDAAEEFLRFRRVRRNTQDLMSIDFVAWDLVRVIMLCRAGLTAGYLDKDEAYDTAIIASAGLQERFGSWEEMTDHFYRGRWYWISESGHDEALTQEHDNFRKHALVEDPNSPYSVVPWETRLTAPQYFILDRIVARPMAVSIETDGVWRRQLENEISRRARTFD